MTDILPDALLSSYQASAQDCLPQAQCLPFVVYHDPSIYQLEAQKIFHQEWVFVCAQQQLANPGDYFAFTLAGEALAIIRGEDNTLRALSNNCRHRGTPLLDEGFGQLEKLIICPYHAWAYDDLGKLKAAPFTQDTPIDKAQHCLPQFHLECWMGLIFVNLADQPAPLSHRLEGLEKYLSIFEAQRFGECYESGAENWQANWKLAMENAMESYHLFKVHKDTLETLTPSKQAYYVAGSHNWSLNGGKMVDKRGKIMKFLSGDYPEAFDHYLLISLPPSFVGIINYDSFDWIQILPNGAQSCSVRAGGMAKSANRQVDKGTQDFVSAFFSEDKFICERLQKGMHSSHTKGGSLVGMEQILIDFRQFLGRCLFKSTPEEFSKTPEAQRFFQDP